MNAPLRLTPTMRSRKLLALEFIQEFWTKRGVSPSYGEIGEAIGGVTNSGVAAIVRQLVREQHIGHRAGVARSITLPSRREEALRVLRAEGIAIHELIPLIAPHPAMPTNPTLPLIPELDHIPDPHGGDQQDDDGDRG